MGDSEAHPKRTAFKVENGSAFLINPHKISWPENVELYQPIENAQMLFSEMPSGLYIQAVLRLSKLNYTVLERDNVESIAPTAEVPALRSGTLVVSGLEKIMQFLNQIGISLTEKLEDTDKCEISAYISLVNMVLINAELFLSWVDNETFEKVTWKRFSSVYPWPLNVLLIRRKRQQICRKLRAMGWLDKTYEDVCHEVETCFRALSNKLDGKYFFGSNPTELDALVFAHVYTILNVPLPKTQFAGIILKYPNIVHHCQNIINQCFQEFNLTNELVHLLKDISK